MRMAAQKKIRMSAIGKSPFDQGMTLIETLVAVGILGLITGIAMPKIDRLIENMAYRQQETDVVIQIKTARARAIQLQAVQQMKLDRRNIYFMPNGQSLGDTLVLSGKTKKTVFTIDAASGSVTARRVR